MLHENQSEKPFDRVTFARSAMCVLLAATVIGFVAFVFFHRGSMVPAASAQERIDLRSADSSVGL